MKHGVVGLPSYIRSYDLLCYMSFAVELTAEALSCPPLHTAIFKRFLKTFSFFGAIALRVSCSIWFPSVLPSFLTDSRACWRLRLFTIINTLYKLLTDLLRLLTYFLTTTPTKFLVCFRISTLIQSYRIACSIITARQHSLLCRALY